MKAKDVILTAIYHKGIDTVRKEAIELAEKTLCSASYVRNIARQVETGKIILE